MAQTAAEVQVELTEVRQAIKDCYKAGQSYSKPGMSFNRVQFDALTKRENELEQKLRRLQDNGAFVKSDCSGC